jgi:hypothetical protein
MERQHDAGGDQCRARDGHQPGRVGAGGVLERAHHIRPGEARQIADGIDDGDAGAGRRARQERRRQRPEHRQAGEDSSAADRDRDDLESGIVEQSAADDAQCGAQKETAPTR